MLVVTSFSCHKFDRVFKKVEGLILLSSGVRDMLSLLLILNKLYRS